MNTDLKRKIDNLVYDSIWKTFSKPVYDSVWKPVWDSDKTPAENLAINSVRVSVWSSVRLSVWDTTNSIHNPLRETLNAYKFRNPSMVRKFRKNSLAFRSLK